ncbi:FAD-dependent oxidoreductase [Hyphomicrobium sp.]|uniref:NAD(P)/FAD-dependent oxidoreductase n=1 Tax=Hyphomicrobium sp. TaxID=82 RepID=UPI0025C71551|nr:FAD-dependent oxidoreductase [Hyphomicrobium sp.]
MAVIGAGLAGLSCASYLRRAGCFVEVFEQERVLGGRVATLRTGTVAFDTGAQYLTARSDKFRSYINELVASGYAARWDAKMSSGENKGVQLHTWYVGTPGMSSIVRPLAESVRVHTGKRVHTLTQTDKGWMVWFEDQTSVGPFAAVAVAIPAPEARLLVGRIEGMVETLSRVRMLPTWAVMVRLDERVLPDQDVYSDMSEVLRWIARNNSKPGRNSAGETIVIHASPSWSRETEDADPQSVAEEIWAEVRNQLKLPDVKPSQMAAHLWRYGLVDQSLGESFIYSTHYKLGTCGDWCLGRLAEHAYESGQGLGRAIASSLI